MIAEQWPQRAFDWLATDSIHADTPLDDYDGFWCVPGQPLQK
jgi:hypothetical protein